MNEFIYLFLLQVTSEIRSNGFISSVVPTCACVQSHILFQVRLLKVRNGTRSHPARSRPRIMTPSKDNQIYRKAIALGAHNFIAARHWSKFAAKSEPRENALDTRCEEHDHVTSEYQVLHTYIFTCDAITIIVKEQTTLKKPRTFSRNTYREPYRVAGRRTIRPPRRNSRQNGSIVARVRSGKMCACMQ